MCTAPFKTTRSPNLRGDHCSADSSASSVKDAGCSTYMFCRALCAATDGGTAGPMAGARQSGYARRQVSNLFVLQQTIGGAADAADAAPHSLPVAHYRPNFMCDLLLQLVTVPQLSRLCLFVSALRPYILAWIPQP